MADKTFLITIGDRTVGGLTARDQMVGRWQVPVADAAVTATGFDVTTGEAMAMGERAPIALLDAAASARMAVAEAITNIASAPIAKLSDVKLSANWMAAAGHPGEDARLYDAVRAVGLELCPALGIAIPVGKDSMSMRTGWQAGDSSLSVTSPLSLIVTAFAPVTDVRRVLTPEIPPSSGRPSSCWSISARGRIAWAARRWRRSTARWALRRPISTIRRASAGFFAAVQELNASGTLAAYHDRSDGGLLVTLLEMAFASGIGLDVDLTFVGPDPIATLFAEELGAVVAVRAADVQRVVATFGKHGVPAAAVRKLGAARPDDRLIFRKAGKPILEERRSFLRGLWSETTHAMQALRDDPTCADEEQAGRVRADDPGLSAHLTFDLNEDVTAPVRARGGARPRVAILREQGVNGQIEMAAAFDRAGFDAVDVHMTDLLSGATDLTGFKGLAACGGFSYGDVLGAGLGWAKSILFQPRARELFAGFFARPDTFALGVCNGCQMLSALKEIIPGAEAWPRFVRNRSDQFEARLAMVEIAETPSVLLAGMAGSRLPIAVAHGEGRVEFAADADGPQVRGGRPGRGALRRSPRPRHRAVPREPERLVPRHHRRHHRRRSRHAVHAAPGARVPRRPALLAPGRLARRRPLDADLPERARFRRLTRRGRGPLTSWRAAALSARAAVPSLPPRPAGRRGRRACRQETRACLTPRRRGRSVRRSACPTCWGCQPSPAGTCGRDRRSRRPSRRCRRCRWPER